jgi:hypothetical protein
VRSIWNQRLSKESLALVSRRQLDNLPIDSALLIDCGANLVVQMNAKFVKRVWLKNKATTCDDVPIKNRVVHALNLVKLNLAEQKAKAIARSAHLATLCPRSRLRSSSTEISFILKKDLR